MKIDSTDEKILYLLDVNARASLTYLSKTLRISRETVNYRIKKLEEAHVIKSFIIKLNLDVISLSTYVIYLKLNNLGTSDYEKFISALSNNSSITWLASLGGQFDIGLEITVSQLSQFETVFSEVLDKFGKYINTYCVSARIKQFTFGKKYLWPDKLVDLPKKRKYVRYSLDSLDKKILSYLSSNARISVKQISKSIQEPPTTIAFRLKQLEKVGIIEGYTSFSDIQKLGYSRFKSLITVRNLSNENEKKLFNFCHSHPNIYYFNKTLGYWTFEIETDVKTPLDYQKFLMSFRAHFTDLIQDIISISIFSEYKFVYWPYK